MDRRRSSVSESQGCIVSCLRCWGKISPSCGMILSWTFLTLVVMAFTFLVLMKVIAPIHLAAKVNTTLVENRCKCVCPHNLDTTTKYNTTVFQKTVADAGECLCENILPEFDEVLCLRCTCSYESRNSIIISVIVFGMLVIIVCLLLYSIFVCIQPLIWKKNTQNGYDPLQEEGPSRSNLRLQVQQIRWRQQVAEERLREMT